MLVIQDRYVLVDGLNGNADVFSFDNFDYLCTIDINEEILSSAFFSEEVPNQAPRIYLATYQKYLYIYEIS